MDARIKLSARFVFAEKACGEFQRIIGSEAAEPFQRRPFHWIVNALRVSSWATAPQPARSSVLSSFAIRGLWLWPMAALLVSRDAHYCSGFSMRSDLVMLPAMFLHSSRKSTPMIDSRMASDSDNARARPMAAPATA